jgi:alpha-D-ribose 1-methylphosphonate 5-triphosphate diphosphatase
VGLYDRGRIANGARADLLLVDDQHPARPRVIAVIAGGRLVHLNGAERLNGAAAATQSRFAAA